MISATSCPGILSLTELIARPDRAGSTRSAPTLDMIKHSALQASQLVQRIVNLHRSKTGSRQYLDFNQVVSELVELVCKVLPRRIRVETQLAAGPVARLYGRGRIPPGGAEPGAQRRRRHAQTRRAPVPRHPACRRADAGALPGQVSPPALRLPLGAGQRHRHRRPAPASSLRSVLHHQTAHQRLRPGPLQRPGVCRRTRRRHLR